MKLYIDHQIKKNSQLQKEIVHVTQYIQKNYRNNVAKCNRLIILCTHLLLSSHKELEELTKHGVPNQFLAMITDRDLKNFTSTDKNNEKLYYIAQQVLQFLAIQRYITYEGIILIENQLERTNQNFDKRIQRNFEGLQHFFQMIKRRNSNASTDENDESIQKLIEWEVQVSKFTYTGREYFRLHPIEKLCCISNDFFHFTQGTWTTLDLLQMKSLLFNCGFPMRMHFSLNEFIEYIVAHPSLIKKLFKEINIELLMEFHPCELPSLKAIEKILKLQNEEYHIVEQYKKQEQFLMLNEQSLYAFLVQDYLKDMARIRGMRTVPFFHFFIDLVGEMRILSKS